HGDCEVKMTLFVAIDSIKRDSDTQAVFEKNEFYSVRISLVGIIHEVPKEVSNNDNAVFDILVTNYTMQELLVFVVNQMKLINNNFFAYMTDINNINITKAKASDYSSSHSSLDELCSSKCLKTDYNDEYRNLSYIEEKDFIEVKQVDYEIQLEADNVVRSSTEKKN
ncbi:24510_t:CDS:2, partial [Cetraspora pellucida]